MKCKKCRKQIPDDSKFCCYCGAKLEKAKMYRRSDGLYEKVITINGKRVYFRAKTEREVERKIIEFQGLQERGPLFQEVADDWEKEHFPTLAYNTQKSYKAPLKRSIERFGKLPIKDINPAQISAFLTFLANRKFSQKTIKNYVLVLNLIFENALMKGDIKMNPMQNVRIPKGNLQKKRTPPEDSVVKKINENYQTQFGLLAFFMLYSGLRKGEALALKYKDIDMENNLIYVSKSVYWESNIPHLKPPKTDKGNRSVFLLDILKEKLPKGDPDSFVFFGKEGLMKSSEFVTGWNEYCKQIGECDYKVYVDKNGFSHKKIVPLISPHQLRHGFATMLHDAGIDPKDAQEILGHATISMTLDVYTNISNTHRKKVFEKLNNFTKNTQ